MATVASVFQPVNMSLRFTGAKPTFRVMDDTTPETKLAAQQQLKAHFDATLGPVSDEEYTSVDRYTDSGVEVNGLLRIRGNSPFAHQGQARSGFMEYLEYEGLPRFEKIIRDMDGLLQRCRLPFDLTVFRGIRSGIRFDDLQPGETLSEPGYLSTTPFFDVVSRDFLSDYIGEREGSGRFVFRIKVKKGTPCIYPDSVLGREPERGLDEVILPRGGKLSLGPKGTGRYGLPMIDAALDYPA